MILVRLPETKVLHLDMSDGDSRKLEEQKGLDTPVVLAVNDVH